MKLNGTLEAENQIILKGGFSEFRSPSILIVEDQKAAGTHAGTPSAINTWLDRDINTIVRNDITGASLSSNVITLPSGTYYLECWATTFVVGMSRMRLYDTTTSTMILQGPNNGSTSVSSSSKANTLNYLMGKFTLIQTSNLKIQMMVSSAQTNGFGRATTISTGNPNWGSSTPVQVYLNSIFIRQ